MNILGIDIKNEVYVSGGYKMDVDVNSQRADHNRAFAKTEYLTTEAEKAKAQTELLTGNNDNRIDSSVKNGKMADWQGAGFNSVFEYLDLQKQSMFYNISVQVSQKRASQIKAYVLNILEQAERKPTKYDEICYLIDEQYKGHTGVFDHAKSDLAHREQYSHLIYDLLQRRINEIATAPPVNIEKELSVKMRNPLIWKPKAKSLGTLFGLLYDAKVIDGKKEDLIKGLAFMFGVGESNLKKAVNQYKYEAENKIYYDPEIEKLIKDLIQHLKDSNPKQK